MVFSNCSMYEIHQISLINKFCFLHFPGMKNVAFFFSAIATQRLKKQRGKQKVNEDHEDSDDTEEREVSQLAGSSSQDWFAKHASIINEKMCPSFSFLIALTTPNGALTSPLAIQLFIVPCWSAEWTYLKIRYGKENMNIPIRNTQHS